METIALDAHVKTAPCSMALEWMGDQSSLAEREQKVRDLVGARAGDRLVFTSSGAEAVNQALWSAFLEVARKEGKTHFVTSCLEDAPTLQMMNRLEELGCSVKIAPANERGEIDLAELEALIGPRTALLSLSMAQRWTGVIQPVEEIARLARDKKVLLHLDASYAVGKYYFSFADLQADYLTFSGDLIHSAPDSGALIVKEGCPLVPLILGKKEPPASATALCAAAHQAALFLDAMSLEVARLRDRFETDLQQQVGAIPAFSSSLRLPNVSALCFPRVHQETLLHFLRRKGVIASIGNGALPQNAVHFSLSRMHSEEEVVAAAKIIAETVCHLRTLAEDLEIV